VLLSRVADRLYWAARYLERAEDTARLVRSYTDLVIDLPISVLSSWEPMLAVAGGSARMEQARQGEVLGEASIVRFLVADETNPSSVASSIEAARENLRTTRDVMPREAWQTVNDLHLYAAANARTGVERRSRARFLTRVIRDCQQFDGVLTTVMTRDEAYELWRLGQSIERADMTTRVVGVRAAALLGSARSATRDGERSVSGLHDDVQWMGLLRSVSALQMYQRVQHGPVDGAQAITFLLYARSFPRSVASCADRIRQALERLPQAEVTLPAVDRLDAVLDSDSLRADDGASLDAAMERVQIALANVSDAIAGAFVRSGT
jgi:uncharacterized alpha-E superfamily protein